MVSLSKRDLLSIGDLISSEFPEEEVIIGVGLPSHRNMTLSKFRESEESLPSVDFVKLHVNRREGDGFLRQLSVELGPFINFVEAQSIEESWAIGTVERIRRHLRPFELPKFLNFNGLGSSVNALILIGLLAYLPSIETFGKRVLYVLLLLALMTVIKTVHERLVPNAYIALNREKASKLSQISHKLSSIAVGSVGAAMAAYFTLKFEGILGWIEALVTQG